jgi:hypothetical protein
MRWLKWLGAGLAIVALIALLPPGRTLITEMLWLKRGADAYLIGYPLVTMQATRDALVQPPARMNAFSHARYLPDARNTVNVVSPSRDTVYSSVWLDLRDGPMLIEQPDMGERYWLMPVLDAWTNVVADPGTRTIGNDPHTLLVAGPDWQGQAPPDAVVYRSPTDLAWAILRIQTGPDLAGVARLQDGFRIAPLSAPDAWAKSTVFERPREAIDVRAQVDALSGQEFFDRLAQGLATQPLSPDDPDAAATLSRIGVTPGEFTPPTNRAELDGLAKVPSRVQQGLTDAVNSQDGGGGATISNGWRIPPMSLGDYGTDYPVRAAVAREGLGANLPEDAVYASTRVDDQGDLLTGDRSYVIDVPDQMPVRAFWSVTVYDDRGNLLPGVDDGLSVSGDRTSGPQRIVISTAKPDQGLWLRAPDTGEFRLIMRLYWPDQVVLDGQWPFPPVRVTPSAD